MSNKRPFDWLGVSDSRSSSKRPKSPAPQATASNISNPTSDANQLSNSSSTSSSTNVPRPRASAPEQAHLTGHAMLSTFKGSMKLFRKGCQAFPPLKGPVDILLEAFETIETTKNDSEELRETVSDLAQWATVLSDYLSDSRPDQIPEFVKRLEEDLTEQARHFKDSKKGGRLRPLLEYEKEREGLERCYRRIETSFHQLQTDVALRAWKIADDHLKESRLNTLNPCHSALYNSSFSDKIERRGCLENTRASVLDGMRGWIVNPSGAKIHWTNGMAGTGKTTIAYSICAELERDGRLGASFFCSRASTECSDVSRILPTIAYQLAEQFYPFRSSLCQILGQKLTIGQRNISVQFEQLIKTPLAEVADILPRNHVVVIDALDECSDPRTVEMMLDALFTHAPMLPVRFFLASRPEPAIANTLLSRDNHSRSVLHLHNVEEQLVKADIETYLTTKLAKLSLRSDQIKQLAEQAGVLFIYAATLARYVLGTKTGANASARLITALTGSKNRKNKKDREIDLLYKAILDGVLEEEELEEVEVELIKQVIWTVVCVREPVPIGTLAALLNVDSEQVSAALEPLRSVLNVLEDSEVISTLHASFPEFILSSERSGPSLCCNETGHHEYLARRCFELMEKQLKFNICGLETPYRFDRDVPDLEARVNASISSGLAYACQYWSDHLRRSSPSNELLAYLDNFLYEQLLFWMEVLNLKRWIDKGPKVLAEAQAWLTCVDIGGSNTRNFMSDAQDFAATFPGNPVCQSTPHIYISALPPVARQSNVWKCYWERTRGRLRLCEMQISRPDAPFDAHTEWITCVSFSPGGAHIVTGSWDKTVRVWDVHSGTPVGGPFNGHTSWVTSVAFSPDGTRIVSGSYDRTIRMWDVCGTPLGNPFKGHSELIASVAFSPGGAHIVSGSWDNTIRVWDVNSGTPVGSPFNGHTNQVTSVAFSPDGTRIVSGSYDCTIRVWDVHSGTPLGSPFKGHSGLVTSVAFSPDGAHIVSGSGDNTIRVWDVNSGTPVGSPFDGHTSWVTCVIFSPDGTRIVSGSYDCTIRVWDMHSRTPLGSPFKGHTSWVSSVAFSPDGTRFVSTSHDSTIRVWQNLYVPSSQVTPFGGLEFNTSGWIVDSTSRAPVFWIPRELHNTFPRPPNTLIISPLGIDKANWNDLLLGASWAQCYDPSNAPASLPALLVG